MSSRPPPVAVHYKGYVARYRAQAQNFACKPPGRACYVHERPRPASALPMLSTTLNSQSTTMLTNSKHGKRGNALNVAVSHLHCLLSAGWHVALACTLATAAAAASCATLPNIQRVSQFVGAFRLDSSSCFGNAFLVQVCSAASAAVRLLCAFEYIDSVLRFSINMSCFDSWLNFIFSKKLHL